MTIIPIREDSLKHYRGLCRDSAHIELQCCDQHPDISQRITVHLIPLRGLRNAVGNWTPGDGYAVDVESRNLWGPWAGGGFAGFGVHRERLFRTSDEARRDLVRVIACLLSLTCEGVQAIQQDWQGRLR